MQNSKLVTVILLISGLVLIGIGAATLFAPEAFHEANDIELGGNASLLNETRATAGALLATGALIMIGAFALRLRFTAAVVGAVIYLSYGMSRVLSVAMDGMPANGLVLATVMEIVIGLACIFALVRHRHDLA